MTEQEITMSEAKELLPKIFVRATLLYDSVNKRTILRFQRTNGVWVQFFIQD